MSTKRYYWIKLHDDFFSSKRIKKLRKIAGGDTYTIIYLKMQLVAMKNNGYLQYSGLENNIADEIALDLDEDAENVNVTLQYLLSTGLCETSDNINYFLPYAVENVGSEGSSAKRVRDYRNRNALQCNNNVTERREDKIIDTDKEKRKDIVPKKTKEEKTVKHKHGEHNNVLLTEAELQKLKAKFPTDWQERIDRLSFGIALKGYSYKSHYLAIIKWSQNDTPKDTPKPLKGVTHL